MGPMALLKNRVKAYDISIESKLEKEVALMNVQEREKSQLKEKRLLKAFEGVKYKFFVDWTDTDRLMKELLGTDVKTILP